MPLLDTIRAQLSAAPTDSFSVSPPRRVFGTVTAATAILQAVAPLMAPDILSRGDGIWVEFLGGIFFPGGASNITDVALVLQNSGTGTPAFFLATPQITTLNPKNACSFGFTPPPLITQEDMFQMKQQMGGGSAPPIQPYAFILTVTLAAGVAGSTLDVQARYRIVRGLQEG